MKAYWKSFWFLLVAASILGGFAAYLETHRPTRQACSAACAKLEYPKSQSLVSSEGNQCLCTRTSTKDVPEGHLETLETLEITLP